MIADKLLKIWNEILMILPDLSVQNIIGMVIETAIIAFIVYEALKWIVDTKAWTLLKGILVIMVFMGICSIFDLNTIIWLMSKSAMFIALAIIVIFQPELRKALEKIGSQDYIKLFPLVNNEEATGFDGVIEEIIKATFAMAKVKTGALMVIKGKESLTDIKDTGILVDGVVSSGLLINIFEKNTPLHDGAVVIEGNRVASATCYLPLSDNTNISKELGTRHRAALGVSEVTDTITIVVSEETGGISVAEKGTLTKIKDADSLRNKLSSLIDDKEKDKVNKGRKKSKHKRAVGGGRNAVK